jgi:hypothetical protein
MGGVSNTRQTGVYQQTAASLDFAQDTELVDVQARISYPKILERDSHVRAKDSGIACAGSVLLHAPIH